MSGGESEGEWLGAAFIPKHEFVRNEEDNLCLACGQPESNAAHPPLPHEAPAYPSLDEQMSAAVGSMRQLSREVQQVDRTGWTREQWVAEAETIMDDIDGSVLALLNGHVTALIEELHDLRRRNESTKALRTFDMQTILRVTPVIRAAQEWLEDQKLWNEADDGKSVADIPHSPHFKPSVKSIENLVVAVQTYNAIIETEEADGNG